MEARKRQGVNREEHGFGRIFFFFFLFQSGETGAWLYPDMAELGAGKC